MTDDQKIALLRTVIDKMSEEIQALADRQFNCQQELAALLVKRIKDGSLSKGSRTSGA